MSSRELAEKHAGRRHWRHAFLARSVAESYECRPAYSAEVYTHLLGLLPVDPRAVLDAGCGTGELARRLAREVERVDAVDPSDEMLRVGRGLPGGDAAQLRWISAPIEDAALAGPYGLAVAGASFHWFDPDRALARFAQVLVSEAVLAMVDGDGAWDAPWLEAELELMYDVAERRTGERPSFQRFDVERDFGFEHPLFEQLGTRVTEPAPFEQPVEDYLTCQHSRASLSLETLGPEIARDFDAELRQILSPYTRDGRIRYDVRTRIEWGRPLRRRA